MPCYHPTLAWRAKEPNPNGKRPLVFIEQKGLDNSQLEVPCGNCIGCRLDRSRQWSLRLMHESKLHDVNSFLTLTYDDEHLPKDGSLNKKHVQSFLHRLRKRHAYYNPGAKLRYYSVGEYGDQTQRPHYHMILFGCNFDDRRPHSKGSNQDQIYTSKLLDEIWTHGHCYIGTVTPESCGYVSRYIMKKINGNLAEDYYRRVNLQTGECIDLTPEFSHMSTKPGIGHDFFNKYQSDFYPRDYAVMKGKKMPVPKYYDRLLARQDENELLDLKELRAERAEKNKENSTTARLRVREEVTKARITSLKRKL